MSHTPTSYNLVFEERPLYLFVHIQAETITRESAVAYLREVADRRDSMRAKRLLIVRDIPVMLSDTDLFFTTRDFLEMIGSTRTAFVNPYVEIDESMNFAMTIGLNRGANYRLFNSVDRAEVWLLRGAAAG